MLLPEHEAVIQQNQAASNMDQVSDICLVSYECRMNVVCHAYYDNCNLSLVAMLLMLLGLEALVRCIRLLFACGSQHFCSASVYNFRQVARNLWRLRALFSIILHLVTICLTSSHQYIRITVCPDNAIFTSW
jgi:hypothetical protein